MGSATQTFDKKSLYHSDLAKAGEITVQFTGKPRDSQYPGKPRWVGLMVQGDDTKYTLNIENADVEKSIESAPTGAWVAVRAEGRGDMAYMMIEDGNGSPVLPEPKGKPVNQHRQNAPAGNNAPPPNEWPEETVEVTLGGTTSASVAIACAMTIAAVQGLEKAGIRVDSDAAARIYNTHFIQASRG
jgi:hypothetical protein